MNESDEWEIIYRLGGNVILLRRGEKGLVVNQRLIRERGCERGRKSGDILHSSKLYLTDSTSHAKTTLVLIHVATNTA
jgi:hypothetical protein